MQQFLCESQKQKIWVANKEFKDVKKNRNVFVHLLAHINQRDRKVSERVEQPTKIISEYIKRLASLLLTAGWTDAKQWKTHVLTLGRSYYISIRVSHLFVYLSGKFVPVRWSAWKLMVMTSTFLIPQKRWCNMQGSSIKTHLNWFTKLCGPESQIIQALPVDHNTSSMKRFHTFLAALKTHKRLTVPYTRTETWIQSVYH